MKTLLAVGCSFTDQNWFSKIHPEIDCSFPKWPAIVGDKLGYKVVNLGKNGNSNDRIFKTTQDYLVNNKVDIICVLWTASARLNVHDMLNVNWFAHYRGFPNLGPKIFDIEKLASIVEAKHAKLAHEHLRNIYMLDQLCTHKNIPVYHMQGCKSFIPFDVKYRDKGLLKGKEVFIVKRMKKYFKALLHSKYFNILEKQNNIYGWPFNPELGGACVSHMLTQEQIISEKDTHPNGKGHQVIADKFMEIIK